MITEVKWLNVEHTELSANIDGIYYVIPAIIDNRHYKEIIDLEIEIEEYISVEQNIIIDMSDFLLYVLTQSEVVTLNTLSKTDPNVDYLKTILGTFNYVKLGNDITDAELQKTINFLDLAISLNVIEQSRKSEILNWNSN